MGFNPPFKGIIIGNKFTKIMFKNSVPLFISK